MPVELGSVEFHCKAGQELLAEAGRRNTLVAKASLKEAGEQRQP